MIDSHSFTVRPSDCDFLGHMNVARYLDACSDAGFTIQALWGLTAEDVLKGRQLAFVVLNANSNFLRELHNKDVVQVRSELHKIGTKSATVIHHFFRGADKVFDSTFTLVLMDLKSRKAIEIPADLRQSITNAHAAT